MDAKENLFLALTNLAVIPALIASNNNVDRLFLFLAASTSFMYHLIECKKHNMTGAIPKFRTWKYHYIFLNMDRIACILVILNFFPRFYELVINEDCKCLLISAIVALGFMLYSETLEYVKNIPYANPIIKPLFIFTHTIWHIYAFKIAHNVIIKTRGFN